ncbi:hypothetical protein ElyMa_000583800 [Elysia marginata]|uniref:Uncharacterized protein n=1 Tax=Elysia marginata TaxID=1093978 RepID=A0AAV4G7H8_9GAST|nr:hypothetical protein ElyMa_000583800 [Elysia marginata]
MFENSVRSFLEYFESSERLMTVDVSCRNADAISSRVCDLFSKLSLRNEKMVNTVLVFTFDKKSIDPDILEENDVDYIRLEKPGVTSGAIGRAVDRYPRGPEFDPQSGLNFICSPLPTQHLMGS